MEAPAYWVFYPTLVAEPGAALLEPVEGLVEDEAEAEVEVEDETPVESVGAAYEPSEPF